jgi:hypothetical protein
MSEPVQVALVGRRLPHNENLGLAHLPWLWPRRNTRANLCRDVAAPAAAPPYLARLDAGRDATVLRVVDRLHGG